jgi:hypothetical protein
VKQVVLVFPSASSMADFILLYQVKGALVNSIAQSMSAVLSEGEIVAACTKYGAELKKTLAHSYE